MAQGSQCLLGLLVHSGIVQKQALFHGASHENIVRNGKLLDNVQLLIHAGDACLTGLNRISEDDLLAVDKNVSLLRSVYAGQHLDQGGLTGAILADQTVDLTGSDANGHIFQCNDTRKTFGNIFQFNDIFAHVITSIPFPDLRFPPLQREGGISTEIWRQNILPPYLPQLSTV